MMKHRLLLAIAVLTTYLTLQASAFPISAQSDPAAWPQLQHDAQRTGRTQAVVGARLRPRWIWFGPDWVLRNAASQPGRDTWDDDLTSRDGHDLDMPPFVRFTFAETMQPVATSSAVFVGDHTMNKVWALSLDDGATLWEADNPGGTVASGVATETTVVFPSLSGYLTAWDTTTGEQRWQVDTGRSITGAPLLDQDTVFVGNHGGQFFAVDLATGTVNWQVDTGAPILGSPAADEAGRVFVGNEAMIVYAFDAATGEQLAESPRLMGQSFAGLWPLIVGDRVVLRTIPAAYIGSEYALEAVLDGSDASFDAEQQTLRNWLQSVDGQLSEHLFALDRNDLSKDYIIPNGPVGGVGYPANPPVLTQNNQPITWWPTYFNQLTFCSFGCQEGLGIDIATFDLETGLGAQLPGSQPSMGVETDNTYGMTVGGNNTLYLRQQFRGTLALNLNSGASYRISAEYRWQDHGGWQAPLNYAEGVHSGDWPADTVRTPLSAPPMGTIHVGPVILPNRLIFTERFAVTVMESY
ncbi:MAG: hypothetical protein CL610_18280 [Anaerolineaceae bacterium]|nr:hypothetical protein [Anaerolineaceae bacterium]